MTPSHIVCARPPQRGLAQQRCDGGSGSGSSIFIALRGCSLWRNTL